MARSAYVPDAVNDVLDKAAAKFDSLTTPQVLIGKAALSLVVNRLHSLYGCLLAELS